MSKLQWFRLYSRMIDDDRLRLLAFEDRWHFVALCCLKSDGLLDDPNPDLRMRRIAVKMGLQLRDLEEVKRRLFEVGLIDENMSPKAWDQLQYKSDTSSERVKKHREKSKTSEVKQPCNVSVTPPEQSRADTERKKDGFSEGKKPVRPSARKYSDDFGEFWKAWKASGGGGDKAPAFDAWSSLTSEEQRCAASVAVPWFRDWRKARPDTTVISAETYLNERRFDGFEPPTTSKPVSVDGKTTINNSDPLWPALVERKRHETGRGVNAESWAFDDKWIEQARSAPPPSNEDLDRGRQLQGLMAGISGNA